MKLKRIGKQKPRYKFFLNPYSDVRFTRCPKCQGPTKQRKIPLLIHIDPTNLMALNKTCRYCPYCDLLIAHQNEIEGNLAAYFSQSNPEVVGNDYLVLGTLDRPDWQKGVGSAPSIPDMLAALHDFKEVLKFEMTGGWQLDETKQRPGAGEQDAATPDPALGHLKPGPKVTHDQEKKSPVRSAESARKTAGRQVDSIWQLKVTLTRTKPPIWRRIQVPGSISLRELHEILQVVMGWQDYHLYEFQVGETTYGDPDPEDALFEREVKNARRVKLSQVAPEPNAKFRYVYDFGDNWEHQIVIEKILPPDPGTHYPICLKGVRATPPEDVGGVWGYEDFLAAIADPEHAEHEQMLDWIGGEWDPEKYDLEAVNAALWRMK